LRLQCLAPAGNVLGPGEPTRNIGREKVRSDIAQPAIGLKGKARFCFERD
jgi:hypothetical protein